VPLGYADGIPRAASNRGPTQLLGKRYHIAGRVCMDQFLLDLGVDAQSITAGTEVQLFGSGAQGEPTAQEWAQACETISYEIIARIGGRVPRIYVTEASA
jgi:alanine racemase